MPISILVLVLMLAGLAGADEHLVPPAQIHERMQSHARERKAALDELETLLAAPVAVEVLARAGLKRADVRPRLESLADEELQDLQRRAEVLRSDPAAGSTTGQAAVKLVAVLLVLVLLYYFLVWLAWSLSCSGECF